jgi:serine/threonine protein phosphatase PrpC
MTLSGRQTLRGNDVLLLCSDGLWAGLTDAQIASLARDPQRRLIDALGDIGARAVQSTAPFADNTTAAAVRWLKEPPREARH